MKHALDGVTIPEFAVHNAEIMQKATDLASSRSRPTLIPCVPTDVPKSFLLDSVVPHLEFLRLDSANDREKIERVAHICYGLQERNVSLVERVAAFVDVDVVMSVFEETVRREIAGGMPNAELGTRKSPGGHFLTLLKDQIPLSIKKAIWSSQTRNQKTRRRFVRRMTPEDRAVYQQQVCTRRQERIKKDTIRERRFQQEVTKKVRQETRKDVKQESRQTIKRTIEKRQLPLKKLTPTKVHRECKLQEGAQRNHLDVKERDLEDGELVVEDAIGV
ncbi:MAG: uncharacterized protein KVP18_004329 [Porospora cf. gigantea A]|uniref:uncharacterized protein n=1 Tax=Porospora cf. gigantea A TaxID=2853593 RepID=UPI00355A98ED|nr:MAG: hypothetical protein KVP18_004329 [Porospora cf. gigantea A]